MEKKYSNASRSSQGWYLGIKLFIGVSFGCAVLLLMALFVYAGIEKMILHEKFVSGLQDSPLVPKGFAKHIAIAIPYWLLAIAFILFIGIFKSVWLKRGLQMHFFTMLLFTIYIATILAFFYDRLPCTCIGIRENWNIPWLTHLGINMIILAINVLALWLMTNVFPRDKNLVATSRASAGSSLNEEGIHKNHIQKL